MRKHIEKLSELELEDIFERSFNYERIRLMTVQDLSHNYSFNNISNRCRIFFNPNRHILRSYIYDQGIEKYFDYEQIDPELELDLAVNYKKAFISVLIYMYNAGQLELKFHAD